VKTTLETSGEDRENTLETSVKDHNQTLQNDYDFIELNDEEQNQTTLQTGVEDTDSTLETGIKDTKITLETSVENHTRRTKVKPLLHVPRKMHVFSKGYTQNEWRRY
jgi:hypothetical protein